jgi:hypothetical protein
MFIFAKQIVIIPRTISFRRKMTDKTNSNLQEIETSRDKSEHERNAYVHVRIFVLLNCL